ncbi:MAG: protein NO VEIN domain-containing protein [Isosphaeraceae bacterium]
MTIDEIQVGSIVTGPLLPEPVEVLAIVQLGGSIKLVGKGCKSGLVRDPILTAAQLAQLRCSPQRESFDADPALFRLGIEAHRLWLAYEYDPFFSLSIARVDPLPHQLEAIYGYFLRMPRIRFLLADDPGAGKTIMAGLLLKELKARGLVRRTLVVAPANLTFQWQRELRDKFRETFEVVRGETLRTTYGLNPWQDRDQLVTSISWVSRVEDAKESLLRSHWDLIIVDEAHKMSAYAEDKKTLAYRLGESLSEMTDHFLLMTATPHKGDPENFCRFLALLDRDVYANVRSLEDAMRRGDAPFYLRRTKEALVTFPDPETGAVKKLFTDREVKTSTFELNEEEFDFYCALTRFVEEQSIRASADDSAAGRAVGFIMAMLQRRMASSVYAVRRSLERMKERREQILADPEAYRRQRIERRIPDDFDDLPEDEQLDLLARLEEEVVSVDPIVLREEIAKLTALINQARHLEAKDGTKLAKLRSVLTEHRIFDDQRMKLLVFTEHKDTLDYLAGDGKAGRPLGKLREWGLSVTQIHGGMKIGDRDTPGTRIYSEREFREQAQVLAATEAAGEGINLQFCWFMINFDIPWNPVRLEQRMGRIHRYGQEHDCLILNFVAINTNEGRVLTKLLERLREIRKELGTDQVFDVVGEIFPGNLLERLFRDLYVRKTNIPDIEARIVRDVNPERFRAITESTLEGLAKKELNLSAIVGKSVEARERRLVPEVVEDFFVQAGPVAGVQPKTVAKGVHVYRVGKLPRTLISIGQRLEGRFGRLGREYAKIAFDKALLTSDPTLEWVTPGHPLFEVVREDVLERVADHLRRGAVFFDLQRERPARLDTFAASIKDGQGHTLHRRLYVVEASNATATSIRQPTIFLDGLVPAPAGTGVPADDALPDKAGVEQFLLEHALQTFLIEATGERERQVETVSRHVEISLTALIDRQNQQLADLLNRQIDGQTVPGLDGLISQAESHLDRLNDRLEQRLQELEMERHCTIADITHLGRAWVLPHPERTTARLASMVQDAEIERIAVEFVTQHERARGWQVESVEKDNRGFDLISRRPHSEDPKTAVEVRFIEVKGRAAIGQIALTTNEYKTAQRLKGDYWLYAVFNCGTTPDLHTIRNPATLGWVPVVQVEHYQIDPGKILAVKSEERK